MTIRIVLVDDHAIVREGLRALLSSTPDMCVVGEGANGHEAVELVQQYRPDVVLLDLVMPQHDGIIAITQIKKDIPETRILVLTSFVEDTKVFAALKAGARGYILKDTLPPQLLQAIRDVYHDQSSLHPTIAAKMLREWSSPFANTSTNEPLTAREREVLTFVAKGWSNQDIAHKLTITERTVGTHMSHILSKLHLASRTQAVLYALRHGLTRLEDTDVE
ncbi:MAG: response regulator transcription factor [Chloroflexi bacterium AL-W]|nr:response regulator transcription factor [Chloroflexi bacterium AL-N1]NOK70665.1 response regulator transcription factor [Chloroflexi bacterium AL-N10]NOK78484.1 response regulator transcription factor [Chloroflexi bacterium AL-N5]NOK85568.1 response regulator transcription factor [Chloroflexi bacterium AL-W]NOK92482.1 response regulator transcription factor [Chloroflexi bacterium AL-N15]